MAAPQEGETTPSGQQQQQQEGNSNNERDEDVIGFQEIRYGMESFYAIVRPGKFQFSLISVVAK